MMHRYFLVFASLLFTSLVLGQSFTSNLPIVKITTTNVIEDEEKVEARFQIMDQNINMSSDSVFSIDELVGIEFRGSSSQIFPKKAYGLEVRDKDGDDKDVSIFGWPEEADYVLFASYNEKSFLHNVISMEMARAMGMYAPRTRFVELMINNQYQGLYVLMEKIKRDKGRVDIAKLDPDENSGDDLTGGYLLKIDKFTGTINYFFESLFKTSKEKKIFYQLDTPKEPSEQQKTYIRNYINTVESRFAMSNYTDPQMGYRPLIDVSSFVKFFLVSEVSRNMDAYRISSFLHKDKDSNDPRLKMGPVWDFDIAYGNADYCEGNRHDLWAYKFNEICPFDDLQVPFWWEKLMLDPYFFDEVRKEYSHQRISGFLQENKITSTIDSLAEVIQVAQSRNFTRWPILGEYVWPQPQPIATTWNEEVAELRRWFKNRILWLDGQFLLSNQKAENSNQTFISPNPTDNLDAVNIHQLKPDNYQLILSNMTGQVFYNQNVWLDGETRLSNVIGNFSHLSTGVYFIHLSSRSESISLRLLLHD